MKAYNKFELEVLELEEDIVRTSGGLSGGGNGGGSGINEDPNANDDLVEDFGE